MDHQGSASNVPTETDRLIAEAVRSERERIVGLATHVLTRTPIGDRSGAYALRQLIDQAMTVGRHAPQERECLGTFTICVDEDEPERGPYWSGWASGSRDEDRFDPGEALKLDPGAFPVGTTVVATAPAGADEKHIAAMFAATRKDSPDADR